MVSTNAATGEVTLDHEAIPGFMDAMTMPYKLKDANVLSELHPGRCDHGGSCWYRSKRGGDCCWITSWS